jgi:glycosyltransferase involved in cell wall biosynthesis
MPDKPLLTIAIPTCGRAHYLDRLLDVLLEQMRGETRVELLVSDNASADKTRELITTYKERGLAIRYIRNEYNLGADRNILQCYELASGKYVWIFSDDDLIAPDTLKRVLDALSTQLYDLVCIRVYFFQGDYLRHRKFTLTPDLDLTRAEDLARHVHVLFTFISGIIVDKERISSMPHRPFDSLLDTNLAQLGPFYTALNHHRRSLLISDPLIAGTSNKNVAYALYSIFGTNLAKITDEWIENRSVRSAIINGMLQKFFPAWILMTRKSQASSIPEDPNEILRTCYGNYFRYWIFDYPIYALPLPLAKIWLLGVRVINKLDTVLGRRW